MKSKHLTQKKGILFEIRAGLFVRTDLETGRKDYLGSTEYDIDERTVKELNDFYGHIYREQEYIINELDSECRILERWNKTWMFVAIVSMIGTLASIGVCIYDILSN